MTKWVGAAGLALAGLLACSDNDVDAQAGYTWLKIDNGTWTMCDRGHRLYAVKWGYGASLQIVPYDRSCEAQR